MQIRYHACSTTTYFNMIQPRLPYLAHRTLLTLFSCLASFSQLHAQPLLQCEVTYAGTTHIYKATVQTDPGSDINSDTGHAYTREAMDIGGRFRFKAVLLGTKQQLDTIKIYAYYETHRQPVLLQEVRYKAPFTLSTSPFGLTGQNFLYSPPLGRELQYGCALLEENG